MDAGEDKDDARCEYAGLAAFDGYRAAQRAWLARHGATGGQVPSIADWAAEDWAAMSDRNASQARKACGNVAEKVGLPDEANWD